MILMVNGRQIPVSDGRVSYEDARWLAGEVERLTEIHEQMKSYYCRCEDRLSSGLAWMFDEDRCEYCRLLAESAEFAGRESDEMSRLR